jgi:hypothetical protein
MNRLHVHTVCALCFVVSSDNASTLSVVRERLHDVEALIQRKDDELKNALYNLQQTRARCDAMTLELNAVSTYMPYSFVKSIVIQLQEPFTNDVDEQVQKDVYLNHSLHIRDSVAYHLFTRGPDTLSTYVRTYWYLPTELTVQRLRWLLSVLCTVNMNDDRSLLLSSLSTHYPLHLTPNDASGYVHSTLTYIASLMNVCNSVTKQLPGPTVSIDGIRLCRNGVTVDRKLAAALSPQIHLFDVSGVDAYRHCVTIVCLRYLYSYLVDGVHAVVMKDSAPVLLSRLRRMHVDSLYWTEVSMEDEIDDIHTRTRQLLALPATHKVQQCRAEMVDVVIRATRPKPDYLKTFGFDASRGEFDDDDDDDDDDENDETLLEMRQPPSLSILKNVWDKVKMKLHPDKMQTDEEKGQAHAAFAPASAAYNALTENARAWNTLRMLLPADELPSKHPEDIQFEMEMEEDDASSSSSTAATAADEVD